MRSLIFMMSFFLFSCSSSTKNKNIVELEKYYSSVFFEKPKKLLLLLYIEPGCNTCNEPLKYYLNSNQKLFDYKLIYISRYPNDSIKNTWKKNYKKQFSTETNGFFEQINLPIIKSGILISCKDSLIYEEYDPFKLNVEDFLLKNSQSLCN